MIFVKLKKKKKKKKKKHLTQNLTCWVITQILVAKAVKFCPSIIWYVLQLIIGLILIQITF